MAHVPVEFDCSCERRLPDEEMQELRTVPQVIEYVELAVAMRDLALA